MHDMYKDMALYVWFCIHDYTYEERHIYTHQHIFETILISKAHQKAAHHDHNIEEKKGQPGSFLSMTSHPVVSSSNQLSRVEV